MKRNLIRDILRDKDSVKASMTKFAALISLALVVIAALSGIYIMIIERKVDYILLGELIALLLTLLGYKNVIKKEKKIENSPDSTDDSLTNPKNIL